MARRLWIVLLLLLPSCSGSKVAVTRPQGCQVQVLERIYFGADTPHGPVRDEQWKEFLAEVVTPRFPAGLSVLEAQGQWLGEDRRIVHELSRVVEIVHDGTDKNRRAIDEITTNYRKNFEQEAVLTVRSNVEACF